MSLSSDDLDNIDELASQVQRLRADLEDARAKASHFRAECSRAREERDHAHLEVTRLKVDRDEWIETSRDWRSRAERAEKVESLYHDALAIVATCPTIAKASVHVRDAIRRGREIKAERPERTGS